MNFSTDIKYLKGVGSARAEAFQRLSVGTVGGFLLFCAFIREPMRIGALFIPSEKLRLIRIFA